ncbi:MAG TPA: 4Fe-4S binding protein, partial [Smithellaceae bacterium]|nr:4Fe-4S binding protein [Smithellaceae bacterium]
RTRPHRSHFQKRLFDLLNPFLDLLESLHDQEKYTDCGICYEERCHFGVLRNEKDGLTVDIAKCLGCGFCVSACPTEAEKDLWTIISGGEWSVNNLIRTAIPSYNF